MKLLTSKSNFAKNRCKIPMAALVPFLLFGCSGGKTGKSDAGEKSKDVQVQTTGSEEQRKLAMGATAVPGVSVGAVFGADADKLMAFGLKELGKSADSLSLAGPVYKLSATAGKTPGQDGCYAILPVTSGSICFDEKISGPRFMVPTVVPGTSAVPKLGLGGEMQKSSLSSKICKTAQDLVEFCFFACFMPERPKEAVVEKPPVKKAEGGQQSDPNGKKSPETTLLEVPEKVTLTEEQPKKNLEQEKLNNSETKTQTEDSSPTADASQTAAATMSEPPEVEVVVIVEPNAETPDSSETSTSTTKHEPHEQTTEEPSLTVQNPQSDPRVNNERSTGALKPDVHYAKDRDATASPLPVPPDPAVTTEVTGGGGRVVGADKSEELFPKENDPEW